MTNTLGKLRNALGREFTKAAMFEYKTVSSLASLAGNGHPEEATAPVGADRAVAGRAAMKRRQRATRPSLRNRHDGDDAS